MADTQTRIGVNTLKKLIGKDSWSETASATGGAATATRTATPGKKHSFHTIIVDYGDAGSDRAITVKFGGVEQFQFNTADKRILNLPIPLQAGTNEAISVEAASGGLGVAGRVTIIGTTIDV